MMRSFQLVFRAMLAAFVFAACAGDAPASPTPDSITLLTEPAPAQACMNALAFGTLVPDPRSGLALAGPTGERTPVMWPFGYSARLADGAVELVDGSGRFIAREGDAVEMGGGFGQDGIFYTCAGDLKRVDS